MATSTVRKRREQGLCIGCGKIPHPSRCPDCLNKHKAYIKPTQARKTRNRSTSKAWRLILRLKAISHYSQSQYRCSCCGQSDVRFLQIDHVNNDGGEHRRSLGDRAASHQLYRWLELNGYPEGFQVLCSCCNMGKAIYGICPHKHPLGPITGLTPAQVVEQLTSVAGRAGGITPGSLTRS